MLKYAALALVLMSGPVFAQAGSTQSPPAPNAAAAAPEPPNSVPNGAMNMSPQQSPNVSGSVGGAGMPAPATPSPGAAMDSTVPTAK